MKSAQDCAAASWVSARELRRCVGLGSPARAGGARPAPSEIDLAKDGWPIGQYFHANEACSPPSSSNYCFQTPAVLFLWTPLSYSGPVSASS